MTVYTHGHRAADIGANTPEHRQLYRLVLAFNDIQMATETAAAILAGPKTMLYTQLFTSIVVSYGRAFSESRPLGKVAKKYGEFEDKNWGWLHEQLLGLRNMTIAHSDLSACPFVLQLSETSFGFESLRADLKREHLSEIAKMLRYIQTTIGTDIQKSVEKLFPPSAGAVRIVVTEEAFKGS